MACQAGRSWGVTPGISGGRGLLAKNPAQFFLESGPFPAQIARRKAVRQASQDRGQRQSEAFLQQLLISLRLPAVAGQLQEIPQAVPARQEGAQLPGQAGPIVVKPHQPPHQGAAARIRGRPGRQTAAQLFQGLLLEPAGLIFLQEAKFQGYPGFLGGQPQELGAKTVKGQNGQTLGGQQLLEVPGLTPKMSQNLPGQVMPGAVPRDVPGGSSTSAGPKEFHDPGAQLARGLAGKGQGQEFLRRLHPGQQGQEAGQQHRGLAGARRGLQMEALPGAQGPVPGGLVGGEGQSYRDYYLTPRRQGAKSARNVRCVLRTKVHRPEACATI